MDKKVEELTLRDVFAAAALIGLMSHDVRTDQFEAKAAQAYQLAEQMLKHRPK